MIKFNEFAEILSEGLSDVLYHFTSEHRLIDIINQDKFILTASVGTQAERGLELSTKNQKLYYLSTSRSRQGDYALNNIKGVFLELDGRELGYKYEGAPVDYWGREFRKVNPRKHEMEDRLYSNDPEIPNAHKYIKSISILVEPKPDEKLKEDDWLEWMSNLRELARTVIPYSEKYDIPVYLYDNASDFYTGNKKKSITTDYLRGMRETLLTGSVKLLKRSPSDTKNLDKDEHEVLRRIDYHDYVNSLNVEIHNNKAAGSWKRWAVDELIKEMRRLKLKSTQDVMLYIENLRETLR